jgi:hypothetical protein
VVERDFRLLAGGRCEVQELQPVRQDVEEASEDVDFRADLGFVERLED